MLSRMRLFATLLFALALSAQQAPDAGQKRAPEPPKNLKLLKPEQIRPAMQAFRTALGVRCDFCHVQGDFSSDENHMKVIARRMIEIANQANAAFPDGKTHVTCYTCHRGVTEPPTTPPPAAEPAR